MNTVKILRDGRMAGFNTDTDGITFSLSKLGALKGGRCVILGAGGAARACAYTVLRHGFNLLVIMNRTRDRAEKVRSDFKKRFPRAKIKIAPLSSEQFAKEIRNCDLLINAITNPFPIETDFSHASKKLKFFDLGYKKPSSILRDARKSKDQINRWTPDASRAGCKVIRDMDWNESAEKVYAACRKKATL